MKTTHGKPLEKNLILMGIFSILVPAIVAALTTKGILSAAGLEEGRPSFSNHSESVSAEESKDQAVAGSKKPVPTPSVPQGHGKGCGPGHPHGDVWATRNEQAKGFELKKCWEGSETTLIDYKD